MIHHSLIDVINMYLSLLLSHVRQSYLDAGACRIQVHTAAYSLTAEAGSQSIIFRRCNFSSFSRQFGRASRGKYPRGLRSPCKINNPYRRFRFSFRSASRVMCLFHFYCGEATSLHCTPRFFFLQLRVPLFCPSSIEMHSATRNRFIRT